MARKKGFRIPGLSFSWKRASGLTAARQRLSRAIGMPTTKQGLKRKLGFYGLGLLSSAMTARRGAAPAAAGGCLGAMISLAVMGGLGLAGIGVIGSLLSQMPDTTPVPQPAKSSSTFTVTTRPTKPTTPSVTAPVHVDPVSDVQSNLSFANAPSPEPPRAVLEPEAAEPLKPAVNPKQRQWASADGKFTTDAEFRSMANGVVKLRKVDGADISVPIDRLSDLDREWLNDYRRSHP